MDQVLVAGLLGTSFKEVAVAEVVNYQGMRKYISGRKGKLILWRHPMQRYEQLDSRPPDDEEARTTK
jgi:hypothetical protein